MKTLLVTLVALVVISALIITGCSSPSTPSTTVPPSTSKPATTSAPPATSAPTTSSAPATSKPPVSSPAAAGSITLNFNTQTPGPAQKANYEAAQWMANEMAARTNGRVKIQIYYNNGLASGTDGINATANGVTDMDETVVGYYPGQFPADVR